MNMSSRLIGISVQLDGLKVSRMVCFRSFQLAAVITISRPSTFWFMISVKCRSPVGYPLDVAEDVRAEQYRSPLLLNDLDDKFEKLPACNGVESQCGVVEDKQLGVYRHR